MLMNLFHGLIAYALSVVLVLLLFACWYRYRQPIDKLDFGSALWKAAWWPLVLVWNVLAYVLEHLLSVEDFWDWFTRRRTAQS